METSRTDRLNSLQPYSETLGIKDAVYDLMENRDGLMLGICNGFQALIKLGLVPEGEIVDGTRGQPDADIQQDRTSCILSGSHRDRIRQVTVAVPASKRATCSPYPVSHGEGRFIASDEVLKQHGCKRTDRYPVCGL